MTAQPKKSTKKGFLISFEGAEGGGKTTQVEKLQQQLETRGKEVITLREPGGTSISEQIREVALSPKNTEMGFTAEVLLFQAARAQLYSQVILPALERDVVVVMDRTRDSSLIYQGMVRGYGAELIEMLNDLSTDTTYPDITFLLDVEVETGLERRRLSGKQDRIDLESLDFHQQVRSSYLQVADSDTTGRWVTVDANKDIQTVNDQVWQAVEKRLF